MVLKGLNYYEIKTFIHFLGYNCHKFVATFKRLCTRYANELDLYG